MVLLGRTQSTHKQTALFDIRIKGSDHDVLVIKGSPNDANSILLSGTIVLSVLEPMTIKKLNLKLYATLRLKWTNSYATQRGTTIKKPYRFEKRVFEHNWDNFEIQNYFTNLYDNYNSKSPMQSGKGSANSSSSSLKSFGKKSKSATNLTSFGSTTSLNQASQSHILLQGNYEFPFSAILPGTTLESVEGLPGASLVYKLQANIERGRFSNDLVAKRHLRIVRTLTPDAVELSETMAVDNTWPKKVEYTISIPSRAVAIGSSTPINMTLVPLAKGLKLGKVKVTLVEYFSCSGSYGPPHTGERTMSEYQVPTTAQDINDDRWEINTLMSVPPSLSKCTQDVDILNNIKVRHKLKFIIGLVNPDGHVSELRASLPVVLFISPFVALGVKNIDRKDSVADNSFAAFSEIPSDGENDFGDDDDVIFAPDVDITPGMATGASSPSDVLSIERQAPPNYGSHIYDRLWNEIPIEDTPEGSRSQTPGPGTPTGFKSGESLNDVRNMGKLTENLRRLRIQRLAEQSQASLDSLTYGGDAPSSSSNSNRVGFTIGENEDDEDDENEGISFSAHNSRPLLYAQTPTNELSSSEPDYFSIRPHREAIVSPGMTPGLQHLSRVNSELHLSPNNGTSSNLKDWKSEDLTKVPSYQIALKSPTFDDFSPAYEPPAFDDPELSRPKSLHLKPSSLNNSRAQSTALLSNLRAGDTSHQSESALRSKTSSTSSSPSISRNASSSILSSHGSSQSNPVYSKSPSKAKFLSSGSLSFAGMTPISNSPPVRSQEASHSSTPPGLLSTHSRSSSFANMMGSFIHKKENKKGKEAHI